MSRSDVAKAVARAAGTHAPVDGQVGLRRRVQRKCGCGAHSTNLVHCEKCARKRIQRAMAGTTAGRDAVLPDSLARTVQSAGRPLDDGIRDELGALLGHDFGRVRIHDDAEAGRSAATINALAYTAGQHVVFAPGMYRPDTRQGRGLLAHELTHVIQQERGGSFPASAFSLDGPHADAQELEAERVRHAVENGQPVPAIAASSGPKVRRLPGSPAGGCGVCYGGPNFAGTAAHTLIQQSFNPTVSTEFLLPSQGDDNGRLDLIKFSGARDVHIGEIKPANPAGLIQGDLDLFWYGAQLEALGFRVHRMNLPPPLAALAFPSLAPPPCPPIQELFVDPPVHGIYTYWCIPDFKDLVGRCPCVRQEKPEKERAKEKERGKEEEKQKERERQRRRPPQGAGDGEPVDVLTPAAVVLLAAALGWLAKQAGKQGGRRVLAPAYVIAAIVLVSQGAEASVGLQGDDALEAMFKQAESNGTPFPEDLKEGIRKDPTLKRIALGATNGGGKDEAKRQLGEHLTRVIMENRDQFTDEDLEELLKVSEQNGGALPNAKPTVDEIKRALAARGKGNGAMPGAAPGTADGGAPGGKPARDADGPQEQPPVVSGPARRLQDALVKRDGAGGRVSSAEQSELARILAESDPPLTDEEVDALLTKVVTAEGRSAAEMLDSLRGGIAAIRGQKPAADSRQATAASGFPAPVETDPKKLPPLTAVQKQDAEVMAKVLAMSKDRYAFVAEGQAVLLTKSPHRIGMTQSGFLVCRIGGLLCMGTVRATPKKKVSETEWIQYLHGGARLYNEEGGSCGVTRSVEVPAISMKK